MTEKYIPTPFMERFAELLVHPECHQLILHLHRPENWPLPVPLAQVVESLNGDSRGLAELILANAEDPGFQMHAAALETATLKVEAEYSAEGDGAVDIAIERE